MIRDIATIKLIEKLESENAILREALERIISVADAYTGKGQLVANQGQAMDGYSALYNFVGEADNAKQALQQAGGGE